MIHSCVAPVKEHFSVEDADDFFCVGLNVHFLLQMIVLYDVL